MIEAYFDELLQQLSLSFAISFFKITKLRIAEEQGFIRIKCNLTNGDVFEFAEYVVIIDDRPKIQSYSYHWQSAAGALIRRWDNAEHHPELPSFPHHLHHAVSVAPSSPMTLQQVLLEIEERQHAED